MKFEFTTWPDGVIDLQITADPETGLKNKERALMRFLSEAPAPITMYSVPTSAGEEKLIFRWTKKRRTL